MIISEGVHDSSGSTLARESSLELPLSRWQRVRIDRMQCVAIVLCYDLIVFVLVVDLPTMITIVLCIHLLTIGRLVPMDEFNTYPRVGALLPY